MAEYKRSTGLVATTTSVPQMTFDWSSEIDEDGQLHVRVNYGGGTETNNGYETTIKPGSTEPVAFVATQNPNIVIKGYVEAVWANDNVSYIVSFRGNMVLTGINNVASATAQGKPIIVCARIIST